MEVSGNFNLFEDKEKPGVLVMIRLIDLISVYLGRTSEEIIKENSFACKRLYAKYLTYHKRELKNKIEVLYKYDDYETSNFREELSNFYIDSCIKIKNKVSKMFHLKLKSNDKCLIDFLIPQNSIFELNEFNQDQILKHHFKIFMSKSDEEAFEHLYQFLLRGDNFKKYGTIFASKLLSEKYSKEKSDQDLYKYQMRLNKLENK